MPSTIKTNGILEKVAREAVEGLERCREGLHFSDALASLWRLVHRSNKYVEEQAPWALAQDPAQADHLAGLLYDLVEALRVTASALVPFLVETPEKIYAQLGLEPAEVRRVPWDQAVRWGGIKPGTVVKRGSPLFPRIETPLV